MADTIVSVVRNHPFHLKTTVVYLPEYLRSILLSLNLSQLHAMPSPEELAMQPWPPSGQVSSAIHIGSS